MRSRRISTRWRSLRAWSNDRLTCCSLRSLPCTRTQHPLEHVHMGEHVHVGVFAVPLRARKHGPLTPTVLFRAQQQRSVACMHTWSRSGPTILAAPV